jgi:LmbE family N-acetylglucosaminyl deacetylase
MRASQIHQHWDNLPFARIDEMFGFGRILVLAPHPDDESLGCGGLIAECCRLGRPPLVVILTDGTGSHPAMSPHILRDLRENEAAHALRELGLNDPDALVFLRLPDTAAPHDGPAFEAAAARIAALASHCTTICAPWRHDPHCDHQSADKLARAAAAIARIHHLSYPVWGWTLPPDTNLADQPSKAWRLDISQMLSKKQRAIAAHRSQHGGLPSAGFELPEALLSVFNRPYEVFLSP